MFQFGCTVVGNTRGEQSKKTSNKKRSSIEILKELITSKDKSTKASKSKVGKNPATISKDTEKEDEGEDVDSEDEDSNWNVFKAEIFIGI